MSFALFAAVIALVITAGLFLLIESAREDRRRRRQTNDHQRQ